MIEREKHTTILIHIQRIAIKTYVEVTDNLRNTISHLRYTIPQKPALNIKIVRKIKLPAHLAAP